ncbi:MULTISPECIES: single-stranded DNA-binding protein [Alphaproteobacteria]|jgi:single-strand DNA-binding protein|uniref:Single-stranded DNA-binding protein n=1 Tax=Maricaulis virginensis TaxID=144022 RepID=A0A9W6MQ10_9PROT|nr:single-stranded DNA-binding protein [Maricaulis virginensis]GLK53519.1 hypothetical protein GCM10017621_30270 [Maricaulis virginensis]
MDMNNVSITGRVGQDPVIAQTRGGHDYARLSIACNLGAGENQQTHWITAWVYNPGLVKIVQEHVQKGQQIGLDGQLQVQKTEENGEKREKLQFVLSGYRSQIYLMARPRNASSGADDLPEGDA